MRFLRLFWIPILALYIVASLWPARFWYNPGLMYVPNSREGERIVLHFTGGVVRGFDGSYAVLVREIDTGKVVCDASGGPFPYRTDATRPDPLTIGWWAPSDPRCANLPAGNYILETCWTVGGLLWGILPPKNICHDPAPFTVLPDDDLRSH